ncbi:MAG: type II toxin-antitoxin system PemK/MazF family toxin [Planctomycetaceae bacterium]
MEAASSGAAVPLIWQDIVAFTGLPTVLVIPLTSRMTALRFPGTCRIDPSSSNGLTLPSVALVFQVGACDVTRIGDRIGELSPDELAQVADLARRLQKLS